MSARVLVSCWLFAFCAWWSDPAAAGECSRVLRAGILPYLSPQVLISLFAPVKEQLQKSSHCQVQLLTAPDMKQYTLHALRNDYDILIAPAHIARLMQVRNLYVPVAQFSSDLFGVVYVAADSDIHELADIRGRKVALTNHALLLNLEIFSLLKKNGIEEADLSLSNTINQNSVLLAVNKGDSDVAFAANMTLSQMPASQQGNLREIARTTAFPNFCICFHPAMPADLRQRLLSGLNKLNETQEGKAFLQNSRFGGIRAVDQKALNALDGYLSDTLYYLDLP